MSAVTLLWRTRLRSSWRAALALVVLIGLGGGTALAVAAGARRTASSFDAILAATNARDLGADYGGPQDARRIEALVRPLDGVRAVSIEVGFIGIPATGSRRDEYTIIGFGSDPVEVGRPVVTAGRMPIGPDEAMLNEAAAAALGLKPGDRVDVALAEPLFQDFETVGLAIVGVGFDTGEVVEDERTAGRVVFVSHTFVERHLARVLWGQAQVKLHPGSDPATVAAALAEKGMFVDESVGEDRHLVQRSLRPLLTTLGVLAGLAGAATVVVAGPALSRVVRRRRADDRSLRAAGATSGQLLAAELLYAGAVALAGVSAAAVVALAASPLFPVGPTRRSRLFRGVDVDPVVLGLGSLAVALALIGFVGFGSWRRRAGSRPISPGRVPGVLAASTSVSTGLRLAAAQRGLGATVAGVAVALSIVIACATFTGSLDRLIGDQALVGMDWDVGGRGGQGFSAVDVHQLRAAIGNDLDFARVTGLSFYKGEVSGGAVPVAVLDAVKGSPWPPVIAGRAPRTSDEVLVGRVTLDEQGIRIGERMTLTLPDDLVGNDPGARGTVSRSYTVVGSAVAPAIGEPGQLTPKLGVGILLSTDALGSLASFSASTNVLFDVARPKGAEIVFSRFPDGLPFAFGAVTEWYTSASPAEVSQAAGARTVIWAGVAALAVAVVATVVHSLLGSVWQRRREYAVLKALGFTRRQVRATVLWQSVAVLAPALLVAVPVGVAAGRRLWTAFAEGLGIVVDPAVPLLLLGAVVVMTVAVGEAASLVPAGIARRAVLDRSLRPE